MKNLNSDLPENSRSVRHDRDGIFIRQENYYRKYLYANLLWVEASGSYSNLHFRDGSRIIIALRIGVVVRYLPPSHFVRVHRGYVLSLFDIDTFVGNSLRIGDNMFPIGKSYRSGVLARLNILNYTGEPSEDSDNNSSIHFPWIICRLKRITS